MDITLGEKKLNTWFLFAQNPQSIHSMYKNIIPQIVEIFDLSLSREGPRLDIVALLDIYPDSPPKKWLNNKSDSLLVTLQFEGISFLSIEGWGINNIGTFFITQTKKGDLHFSFEGENISIEGISLFLTISRLTPLISNNF